jgi:riboflavin kinase/FMN adenylyltransferase
MKVFTAADRIDGIPQTAVALGNFDGVHLGHAGLISRMVACAKERGIAPAVFTFSNHPYNVIRGETAIRSIVTGDDKQAILESLGVEYLFSFDFKGGFHAMTPETFIDDMLLARFNAKAVFCGFNFRFGAEAVADPDFLRAAGEREDFYVDVMAPYKVDGALVSSSLIRELIGEGKMTEAAKFLGRPFSISGEIGRGNSIGRGLGFPTANIALPEGLTVPAFGVYVTESVTGGDSDRSAKLRSVTNVGIRPTIGDKRLLAETHIFGVPDEDLYGKHIKVSFLEMLRPEKKFNGIESLKAQVEKDKEAARSYRDNTMD